MHADTHMYLLSHICQQLPYTCLGEYKEDDDEDDNEIAFLKVSVTHARTLNKEQIIKN